MTASVYTSEQIDALLKPITDAIAQMQQTLQALQQQVTALTPAKPKESKEGTTITPGSGTITDSNGDVWSITQALFIQKNGLNAYNNWQSTELAYHNHGIYQFGLDKRWWQWTGAAFVGPVAAPV